MNIKIKKIFNERNANSVFSNLTCGKVDRWSTVVGETWKRWRRERLFPRKREMSNLNDRVRITDCILSQRQGSCWGDIWPAGVPPGYTAWHGNLKSQTRSVPGLGSLNCPLAWMVSQTPNKLHENLSPYVNLCVCEQAKDLPHASWSNRNICNAARHVLPRRLSFIKPLKTNKACPTATLFTFVCFSEPKLRFLRFWERWCQKLIFASRERR